ncbi:DUF1002 domain-containing protein [Clostridium fallax]|uniref:Uncharacterized protein YpuA, DUF1002 family n=1 Tax=Clostridium fallax TaxID=1533 RepID=A0A1M4XHG6_9CLOT|nr:DUF1002 domain-containing protein [Clostridium fallax]SHE92848.1 Uncharacterized protein YpuA, DUF1002 family [Clostridium fallax]SQB06394.1 extracellular protein [Clostridium fallax]
MGIKKRIIALLMTGVLVLGTSVTAFAEVSKIVTLGADLTPAQKQEMFDYFKVNKDDVCTLEVTNQDIRKELGLDNTKPIKGSQSISSSYVELLSKGNGINVSTHNLTEVTGTMLSNALITAGITDANVIASAPFPVTGTAALSGILMAFEKSKGEEIKPEQKQVAQKEVNVTKNLGNEIGKEKAAGMINDVKTEVIKEKPKSDKQIEKIVNKAANTYAVKLSPEDEKQIQDLMQEINKLNINFSDVKNSLNLLNDKINTSLKDAGIKLKESGILDKILDGIKSFYHWIVDSISANSNSQDKDKPKEDEKNSETNVNNSVKTETNNNENSSLNSNIITNDNKNNGTSSNNINDNTVNNKDFSEYKDNEKSQEIQKPKDDNNTAQNQSNNQSSAKNGQQ